MSALLDHETAQHSSTSFMKVSDHSPEITQNIYLHAATADNTRLAYQSDVRHFEKWGGLLPATSQQIISYLNHFATSLSPRTLSRRLTALKQWHVYQGFQDPTHNPKVKKMLLGITRTHAKPAVKAHPLSMNELTQLTDALHLKTSNAAMRDLALFLLGYFGAFRRAELTAIRITDLRWVDKGVEILIPAAKTDPIHEGQYVALPFGNSDACPVIALRNWLTIANIKEGYIFRSIDKTDNIHEKRLTPAAINYILKKRAKACGLSNTPFLSSHSFRRGVTTAASYANASLQSMMRHGRWKNVKTLLGYIDAAERFTDNMASLVMKQKKSFTAR